MLGWVALILGLAFGLLAYRDLRTHEIGLGFTSFCRFTQPLAFWALWAFEAVFAFLCLLVAVAVTFVEGTSECDANGACEVTIRVQPT